MALTPLSGSSSTPPVNPTSIPNDLPTSTSALLSTMPFITSSEFNKTAIDASQYPQAVSQMIGYMKGKRISVTYYRLLNNNATNNRANIADMPVMRNVINTQYQKILNLELTLPGQFQFTPSTSSANMTITGQVMFYPYMNPSIGDIFLTGIGDGRIGLCRISSVNVTSWRDARIYNADFVVQEFLDETTQAALDGMVGDTVVFSKENYLGGTASLLSEQTYLQLQQIKGFRSNLCKFFHQTFFDPGLYSYVNVDGSYDPWLVQFMTNKLSNDDHVLRPKNLLGMHPRLYQQTLWARLEDRYNNSLYGIYGYSELRGYNQTRMGAFVTELYGHFIVFPTTDSVNGTSYVYSQNFYTGNTATMTPEELLVYTAITTRNAGDLASLISTYLSQVFTMDPADQFYKIPLYIHLIDMSLQNQFREIDAPSMNFASTDGTM